MSGMYPAYYEDEEEEDSEDEEEHRRERMLSIQARLPLGWAAMPVRGNHRKACTRCGKRDWMHGDWYFTNQAVPWDADKLCEGCIEGWLFEQYLESDSDEDLSGEESDEAGTEEEAQENDVEGVAEAALGSDNPTANATTSQRASVANVVPTNIDQVASRSLAVPPPTGTGMKRPASGEGGQGAEVTGMKRSRAGV